MNPFTLLKQAISAVPSVKYALGVAGLAAVVAIVLGFKLNQQVAVFGVLIVIGLMFILVIFSRFAGEENVGFIAPATILVWFYTVAIIAATTLFMTSYFIHIPIDFRKSTVGQVSTGNATVYDGFRFYDQSTFNFVTGKVKQWGDTDVDLGVANPSHKEQSASFFLYNNHYPYTNLDPNATHQDPANAGIVETDDQNFNRLVECPATGYIGNYFDPVLNHVYCIRTHDGRHYAKIIITDLEKDRVSFDYVFQPDGSTNFGSTR